MGLTTVVATAPGREQWLTQCLQSLAGRDVLVVSLEHGFELGKIEWVYRNTTLERFLFLQDSAEVLSKGFWGRLEEFPGSVALLGDPSVYGSYMGVYERKVLDKLVGWPLVDSKMGSIANEIMWTRDYADKAGSVPVLFPDLTDSDGHMGEKFGRMNLVLENQYFRKWKGTWK
jgi:hypothetical protein